MEFSEHVRGFMERQRVARLATVDSSGKPHLVPIAFAIVDDCIYTAIDQKPKRTVRLQRLRNVEANSSVAVLFDVYSDEWGKLAWAMVRGRATILEEGEQYDKALRALRARYPQYERMALEGRPVIRIDPERLATWGL